MEDEDDLDEAYFYVEESLQVVVRTRVASIITHLDIISNPNNSLVQDDLAEHTVASPPQINAITSDDSYDPFDYWEDIENCTDGYVDSLGPQSSRAATASRTNQKRKSSYTNEIACKERRIQGSGSDAAISEIPPVSWKSAKEKRPHISESRQVQKSNLGNPITICKDWRERFKDKPGFITAANAEAGDSPPGVSATSSDDVGSQDEHQQQVVETLGTSNLNVDALKSALTKNLASSDGLPAGLDESTLLEYMMQMVTNGDKTEGLLGQLTDELFEGADDSNVEDIQEWVSRQKGDSDGENVESSREGTTQYPNWNAGPHKQPESKYEQDKPIEAVPVGKGVVDNRMGKRKTTEMDCGVSLKPQAKRRNITHTRKGAKVL